MARKPKPYEIEYEYTVTVKATVEATSQSEAVRLAKAEPEDYEWEETNRTSPFKVRIAGTKSKSWNPKYRTHDGEWGSEEKWRDRVETVLGLAVRDEALTTLGLEAFPETLVELKQARRKAQLKAHPDLGGSEEESAKVNEAFAELSSQLKKRPKAETKAKKEP